jgi:glutathione S-transferase
LEALAFISTELHGGFKPFWHDASESDRQKAEEGLARRFQFLADRLVGPYLFGARFTVADAYLFVMLRWASKFGVALPPRLVEYFEQVTARDAVRVALAEEGLGA